MSANHLSPVPPPAWTWKIPDDQHPDKFFPPQRPHYHHHQQLQQQQLLPEGNRERRELLFEKPLTPSDVGKLNRLVIPKQHAERHFPFYGDSSCGEKGLLLTFEDESGRAWQFRYSYWTSSQSYVLTKGWSRFVKDKKLDAGDVVLFERRRGDGSDHRLYIGCKRRGEHSRVQDVDGAAYTANINVATTTQWNPAYHNNYAPSPPGYSYTAAAARTGPLHDAGEQVGGPAARAGAGAGTSWRRLRLFGVNLDCGPEQEQPESRMPSSSSSGGNSNSNSNSNSGLCMDGYGRSHRLDPTRSRGYSSPQW